MIEIDNFGEKIRENRERLGMTQEDLAVELYVSVTTIANWEHERTEPTIDDLIEMSRVFQISVEEILGLK